MDLSIRETAAVGFAGLGAACLVTLGLLAAQPTRQAAIYAFAGTPTPVPPPRLEAADVLIAEFDSRYATRTLDVAHRLEVDLKNRLQSFGMDDINVQVLSQPVASEAEAQMAVNDTGSRVVIWGWYDDAGIQVRVFLSGGAQAGSEVPGTNEIPLATGGENSTEISFVVRDVLPENVSFLSLFVIGHLEYLSNHYEAGHRAFDAAMNNMPGTVAIENEAILHFFQARQMDAAGADVKDVICEYAKAIELDPKFAEPYNNLGVIVSSLFPADSYGAGLPSEAYPCLVKAGLDEETFLDPMTLYGRALELNPNLTVADFNQIAYLWRNYSSDFMYQERLEEIQGRDASILGTYIILGIIRDRAGDPAGAIPIYEAGIEIDPNNELLHFNLGQLYLSYEKDEAKAEKEFQSALELDPDDLEARLALGNLYFGQGKLDEALGQVDFIPEPREDETSTILPIQRAALILRSAILFNQDQIEQAIEVLRGATQNQLGRSFEYLLLGLLEQSAGREAQAREDFASTRFFDSSSEDVNETSQAAWSRFLEMCFTGEASSMAFEEWALNVFPTSTCLPTNMKTRINAIYGIFHDLVLARRAIPPVAEHIMACPFVYSYNSATGRWEFQTTILYQLENHEDVQMRPLTQFDGRLLIREEEREVSYINRLYVLALLADGSVLTFEPQLDALKDRDSEYVVLHQGEEILVTLEGYPASGVVDQWWVAAAGYYVPVR